MRNIFGEVLKSSSNFSIARAVWGIIIAFVVLAALGLIFVWPETYVYEVKLIDTRPSPPSTFQPPENVYNERRRSLELVKERSDAKSIEKKNPGYEWTVIWARNFSSQTQKSEIKDIRKRGLCVCHQFTIVAPTRLHRMLLHFEGLRTEMGGPARLTKGLLRNRVSR
jgi:hypothetical protein